MQPRTFVTERSFPSPSDPELSNRVYVIHNQLHDHRTSTSLHRRGSKLRQGPAADAHPSAKLPVADTASGWTRTGVQPVPQRPHPLLHPVQPLLVLPLLLFLLGMRRLPAQLSQ